MSLLMIITLALSTASAQTDDQAVEAEAPTRPALTSRAATENCSSEGLRRVAWSLNVREQALDRRERMLAKREEDLVKAQKELERWITDLEGVRDEIAGMLNLHSDEDKKIDALKEMVENMRPKQAAQVLAELKVGLAVKVIDRMDRSKAGKAMAVMEAKKAAQVAEQLTKPITVGAGQ